MADPNEPDPRVYFAAERTFLAWIRTGLALMGFGFVAARLGAGAAYAHLAGIALIGLGVLLTAGAARMHVTTIRRLNRGEAFVGRPTWLGMMIAVVLIVIGALMIVYLGVWGTVLSAEGSQGRPQANPPSHAVDVNDPIVKAVQAYLAAVRTGHRDALKAIVVPEAASMFDGASGQAFIQRLQDTLPISSTISKVDAQTLTATVTLSERRPEFTHTIKVLLKKIRGNWKIDPR